MKMRKGSLLHTIKNHFVAALGEFVGTFLFLFFAFAGAQTANQPATAASTSTGPNTSTLLYISLVFGFSLAINVWIFFRVSGGLFNPAVTIALCVCRVVPVVRSIFIFIAQILGGIAASGLVAGLIPGGTLYSVSLLPSISVAQGLFLEMFLTAELVFTILMLAAEKQKSTFIAPIGIGLALFVAELVGVYWTGGALNPARAFGPAVIQGSFPSYHWIYWLGPVLGALLASGFYGLLKVLNYEEVNGDQDKSAEEIDEEKDRGNSKRSDKKTATTHERSASETRRDYEEHKEKNDNRYEQSASREKGNHVGRTGSRKNRNLSSAPIHNQRWSREVGDDAQNYGQNDQAMYGLDTRDSKRPPQTIHNQTYNASSTRHSNEYAQREQRSRAFVPEPTPIVFVPDTQNAYDYKEVYNFRPVDATTGKPYVQDPEAATRSTRRVSLSRRDRERGYRTDNVDEVGGPASHDVHRASSGKRAKQY